VRADGVGLRIHSSDSALGADNFGERGLTQSGETWTPPGLGDEHQRIDLNVSANLGSVNLNPEAGCD
jgi:hypothetical protein